MGNTFTATLVEVVKRLVSFDTKLGVYTNGDDNNYPERMERIINNSVTAKQCASLMRKYIIGKGFDGYNDIIVDPEKETTLYQLLGDIASNYAYQKGFALHAAGWDFSEKEPLINRLCVIPFKSCRIGERDDTQWSGKVAVYDEWSDENAVKEAIKKNKIQKIDAWNYINNVIADQVKKQGGFDKYKGQLFITHPDQYVYPLAHIDGSATNDADSEFRASTFKNISLRKGFFGKMMVITPPLLGDFAGVAESNINDKDKADYYLQKSEREKFKETLQSFIGAQNGDGVMHVEAELQGDDIAKQIKFEKVETNIDDKLFAHTEETASKNIRKAFQNVPSILIESSDNSIFGDSGALLKQAKLYYQEQLEDERTWITGELKKVLKHFDKMQDVNWDDFKITPLHEPELKPVTEE